MKQIKLSNTDFLNFYQMGACQFTGLQIIGVCDITGIPVNQDLRVPRFVSRYAFNCTGTLGKLCQFSEHGLAAFVLSCISIQTSFFI